MADILRTASPTNAIVRSDNANGAIQQVASAPGAPSLSVHGWQHLEGNVVVGIFLVDNSSSSAVMVRRGREELGGIA